MTLVILATASIGSPLSRRVAGKTQDMESSSFRYLSMREAGSSCIVTEYKENLLTGDIVSWLLQFLFSIAG